MQPFRFYLHIGVPETEVLCNHSPMPLSFLSYVLSVVNANLYAGY